MTPQNSNMISNKVSLLVFLFRLMEVKVLETLIKLLQAEEEEEELPEQVRIHQTQVPEKIIFPKKQHLLSYQKESNVLLNSL